MALQYRFKINKVQITFNFKIQFRALVLRSPRFSPIPFSLSHWTLNRRHQLPDFLKKSTQEKADNLTILELLAVTNRSFFRIYLTGLSVCLFLLASSTLYVPGHHHCIFQSWHHRRDCDRPRHVTRTKWKLWTTLEKRTRIIGCLVLLVGIGGLLVDPLVVALCEAVSDRHQEVDHHGQDELLKDPADDVGILELK